MRLFFSTGGFSIAQAGFFICYTDLFVIPNFDVPDKQTAKINKIRGS